VPIASQTPLTTIAIAKELKLSYQPLLLCELVFPNAPSGSNTLYLSSENMDATEGGFPYLGNNYIPRVLNKNIGAIQAISDNGITQSPRITLNLADADKYLFNTWEYTYGFMGAKVTVFFVFWDPGTSTFSSDTLVKFVGVCNPPNFDEGTINVTCTNILNMSRVMVPTCQISQLCRWDFPTNHAQRVDGAVNQDSNFYNCGYSPDVTNTDAPGGSAAAVGNRSTPNQTNPDGSPLTDSSGNYVSCDLSWASCIARLGNSAAATSSTNTTPVQIERDTSGRLTGRFSGIHYDPPGTYSGPAYLSGTKVQGINNPNVGKYGQYYPQIWGTCFVYPPVMQVIGDPNSTRMEVVLCLGQIWPGPPGGGQNGPTDSAGPIQMVIVNDYIVPYVNDSDDKDIQSWYWINYGSRNGSCNRLKEWSGMGDPYGGMATIAVVVPAAVAASNAIPQVQVLTSGPKVRVFTSNSPTSFTLENTADGPMLLLDFLTWCGFQATTQECDFDLQSFINSAAVADAMISYLSLTGTTSTHGRYRLGWFLKDRRSAADVLKNLLMSMKGTLSPSSGIGSAAGLLQLSIDQTLADQQPSPMTGSNDNTPRSSATAAGSPASGYVAYAFNESNILRKDDGINSPSTFTIEQRGIYDTPNEVSITFQDEDFSYGQDSLTIDDTQHISRSGQKIGGSITTEGLQNFDQAARCIQTQLATQFRGNPRTGTAGVNDPGGTWIVNFQCSFRGIYLNIGNIISITIPKYQLNDQWFRIISVSPDPNAERITIRARWHEDDWYLDSYGQNPAPLLQQQQTEGKLRPPLGWGPNQVSPVSGDPLWAATDANFDISQGYQAASDGSSIATVVVTGKLPVNKFTSLTSPPYLTEAAYVPSGGTLAVGTYYYSICAIDSAGNPTAPSWPPVGVPVTANNGAVSIPNIYWQAGTSTYKVYGGRNANLLTLQASGSGTPSSLSLTSYVVSGEQAPDVEFNNLNAIVYGAKHLGIIGAAVVSLTSTTITLNVEPTISLAGRILSVFGISTSSGPVPLLDFEIASSSVTSGEVTVTISGAPNLTTLGFGPGDAVTIRAAGNIFGSSAIGDSGFASGVNFTEPPFNIIATSGGLTTDIAVTFSAPTTYSTGDTVTISGALGLTAINGTWTLTVLNSTQAVLQTARGTGTYAGGGICVGTHAGLLTNAEKGNIVIIIAGTGAGQWRSILTNSSTTLNVDTEWDVTPDATSIFIVLYPNPITSAQSKPVQNSDPTKEVTLLIPVPNFSNVSLWVQVFTESAGGKQSIPQDSPFREIFLFGSSGSDTAKIVAPQLGTSGAPVPPGNPSGITVTGFINSVDAFTLTVSMTIPTDPGDTFVGAHLYLEIPDQSATANFTVGINTVGDGSTTTGPWSVIDLGKFPFSESQPWNVTGSAPANINPNQNIPCRLYCNPYSVSYEAPLVEANQTGASPNVAFILDSLTSGSPTSGTNVTTLTGGDGTLIAIVATALSPVNVSGKLETPFIVDVSDTPANTPGWVAQLVLTVGTSDPTQVANQQVVGSLITQAGPVYAAPGDGISVPHSFALDTPTAITTATIWLQAGLKSSKGTYSWNNIVPGITPSFMVTYGSTVGTTDATAIMTATIDASMAVVNKLFGVAAAGITNPLMGSGAVATINIQALAVTNPLLASLCVQAANLDSGSVTSTAIAALAVGTGAIQTAAITTALIANAAVSNAKIQSATITGASIASATIAGANIATATIVQANMASASIGTAQIISASITDALISNCSINKLTAGTASFTATSGSDCKICSGEGCV